MTAAWDVDEKYGAGELVTYQGVTYLATTAVRGVRPTSNPWVAVDAAGVDAAALAAEVAARDAAIATAVAAALATVPRDYFWYTDGVTAIGDGIGPTFRVTHAIGGLAVGAVAETAPVTSAYTFDLQTADTMAGPWTSLFSVLPSIADGAQASAGETFSQATIAAGKLVRMRVTAAGGTPAQSVTTRLSGVLA